MKYKEKITIDIFVEVVAGVYLTGIVVFFWGHPLAASLMLAAGIGIWVLRHRNKADVATMLAAALLGTPSDSWWAPPWEPSGKPSV